MSDPYLSIVIPAYNEALRVGKTLVEVQKYAATKPFEVEMVLVDDGSRDGTLDLFREFQNLRPGTCVLCNEVNRGKGFSVRRGVLQSRGEVILFTDADLSAPIEEADKLLASLESGTADAAIGSRAIDRTLIGVRQPWRREYAGRFFNLLVRLFTGLKIHDTQCGLKLFRRETTRRAFDLQRVDRFGFDPEVLFLIQHFGGKIVEIPVRWNDNPATKVHILRDSALMFLDLIVLRWRAWAGWNSD
ncbi:MAG TPA: dolichyl-phosphate beta-glucosyltransferase [Terriglobia bacterium]|nr:dolichyl-phosphate beta-glucosyltransferase [Terriglobia bacterium]